MGLIKCEFWTCRRKRQACLGAEATFKGDLEALRYESSGLGRGVNNESNDAIRIIFPQILAKH